MGEVIIRDDRGYEFQIDEKDFDKAKYGEKTYKASGFKIVANVDGSPVKGDEVAIEHGERDLEPAKAERKS